MNKTLLLCLITLLPTALFGQVETRLYMNAGLSTWNITDTNNWQEYGNEFRARLSSSLGGEAEFPIFPNVLNLKLSLGYFYRSFEVGTAFLNPGEPDPDAFYAYFHGVENTVATVYPIGEQWDLVLGWRTAYVLDISHAVLVNEERGMWGGSWEVQINRDLGDAWRVGLHGSLGQRDWTLRNLNDRLTFRTLTLQLAYCLP